MIYVAKAKKLIIIGAGGHALSVMASAGSSYKLAGFIDENKSGNFADYPILAKSIGDIENPEQYCYFIAIGDNETRKRFFDELVEKGLEIASVIDKSAIVDRKVKIGKGNFIGKLAVIIAGSEIGDNNLINSKALIEHGCKLGSHINISTNATLNGDVVVEDGVFFGSSAVCNGQKRLGENALIGSGAVVVEDVEPNVTVVGVPAKKLVKKNK